MRIVLVLLLLANLALFAFTRLDVRGGAEPQRLAGQVQPEKIRILTPQEVAALGPAKVASLADVCVEWGPLSDTERARAMADLAPLGIAALVTTRRVDIDGWPVTLNGFPTRASAERRALDLKARGLGETTVVESPAGTFAIVVGLFRSEQAANGRADALAQQGITGARVGTRRSAAQTMLVLRDPPQPAVARLRELQPAYAGTEIRVGGCERTS